MVEGELQSLRVAFGASDLADLLAQIALRREEEEALVQNTVNIMSMHKAKGLDACVVFVAAAEEELLPGPNNRDEERRLLYVSLTRARHALFVTHSRRRMGAQRMSGIGNPNDHHRTGFLDASGLVAVRGAGSSPHPARYLSCSPPCRTTRPSDPDLWFGSPSGARYAEPGGAPSRK